MDSKTTKKAFADAMKETMNEMPFSKITISDLCDRCGMSRKSFYYHFKDKYDLVNWIFESEYVAPIQEEHPVEIVDSGKRWELIEDLCTYFFDNIHFYSKVFKVKGQNCFGEYLKNLLSPILELRVQSISSDKQVVSFCVNMIADAAVSAIEQWIIEKNPRSPKEFVQLLRTSLAILANSENKLNPEKETTLQ